MIGRLAGASIVGALAAVAGCSSSATTSTNVVGPTPVSKCAVGATASASSFGSSGGNGTIKIDTQRECSWNAATTASWIAIQGATSGQGSATLGYSVANNSAPAARKAALVVESTQVDINQDGAPCRFSLDRSTAAMTSGGGSVSVTVSSMAGCAWNATSRVDWIAVAGAASGTGTGDVAVSVRPNVGGPRSGAVAIADQLLTVAQDGPVATPPPVPAPAPPTPAPTPAPPTPTPAPEPTPTPTPTPPTPAPTPSPTPAPTPPTPTPPTPTPPQPTPPTPAPPPRKPDPPPPAPSGPMIEVKGRLSDLRGSCPNVTFTVDDRSVAADPNTDFHKRSCWALRNGAKVTVKGRVQANGVILASRIDIKEDGHGDDDQGQP